MRKISRENDESNRVGVGSDEHKEIANEKFEKHFSEMTELMEKARSVELRLRMLYEIRKHTDHHRNTPLDKYMKSNFKVDRRSFDRLIKDLVPEERNPVFQAVRLIAEPLAHADYAKAKAQIDDFTTRFNADVQLNTNLYRERSVGNILNQSNELVSFEREIDFAYENLIYENFLVFKTQGYLDAANQIIESTLRSFSDNANLGWKHELYLIQRTLRYGNEISVEANGPGD